MLIIMLTLTYYFYFSKLFVFNYFIFLNLEYS